MTNKNAMKKYLGMFVEFIFTIFYNTVLFKLNFTVFLYVVGTKEDLKSKKHNYRLRHLH